MGSAGETRNATSTVVSSSFLATLAARTAHPPIAYPSKSEGRPPRHPPPQFTAYRGQTAACIRPYGTMTNVPYEPEGGEAICPRSGSAAAHPAARWSGARRPRRPRWRASRATTATPAATARTATRATTAPGPSRPGAGRSGRKEPLGAPFPFQGAIRGTARAIRASRASRTGYPAATRRRQASPRPRPARRHALQPRPGQAGLAPADRAGRSLSGLLSLFRTRNRRGAPLRCPSSDPVPSPPYSARQRLSWGSTTPMRETASSGDTSLAWAIIGAQNSIISSIVQSAA